MEPEVLLEQLERHLDGRPVRVLDVDAVNGSSADSGPPHLVRQGFHVVVTELERLRSVDGHAGASFDIVLCHRDLAGLAEPGPAVVALCDAVAAGGVVSLVTHTERLEEVASYIAGRRMHLEARYALADPVASGSGLVHLVGRRASTGPLDA